ncbi:MAG: hypothetical protein FJ011_28480 [Chloroflexi bacterium]|nr:hypothetical protein [Chloroflexota bacterium]
MTITYYHNYALGLAPIVAEVREQGAGVRSQGAGEQSPISNLQSSTSISYAYDAAGRLVSANYGGAALAYTYDAAGNLVGVSPGGGGYSLYLPLALH